jgi:hypothetical protein
MNPGEIRVNDPGHRYEVKILGGGLDAFQHIVFVKMSCVTRYLKEWAGIQSQALLRVLIDRQKYLDSEMPCSENKDVLYHLRQAFFCLEARAFRRKKQGVNGTSLTHKSPEGYDDIPFTADDIELRRTDKRGHIVLSFEEKNPQRPLL